MSFDLVLELFNAMTRVKNGSSPACEVLAFVKKAPGRVKIGGSESINSAQVFFLWESGMCYSEIAEQAGMTTQNVGRILAKLRKRATSQSHVPPQ